MHGARALVVDLARGVLTHNIQRGGATQLSNGKLARGFAVFAEEGKIGVAPTVMGPRQRESRLAGRNGPFWTLVGMFTGKTIPVNGGL